MNFTDWLDHVLENVTHTLTCEDRFTDPAEIAQEAELALVRFTGHNLNNIDVNYQEQ
jgi:hypothetical protein